MSFQGKNVAFQNLHKTLIPMPQRNDQEPVYLVAKAKRGQNHDNKLFGDDVDVDI